ncbi:GntP family permease [Chondrinema litorale]|uniref:GntP family permease n=1 Tax=Chondrinema litorale TaxID=2994555 RepID=UPI002542926B|nr:GntP family permease [Chondrinema litorale]UZR93999.1 GntP family permease [Chondrinema litorale]
MLILFYLLISILILIVSSTKFKLHPFFALIISSIVFGFLAGIPTAELIITINKGFGDTLGSIGLIIILGSVIGKFLEKTGGAIVLADNILKLTNNKAISLTMALVGYVVSIPVFADSGFIILSSLKKSLAAKAKISVLGPTIALSVGLLASHSMLPPTPGPVAATGIIGANLGLVILFGMPISLFGVLCAWFFVEKMNKKVYISPGEIEKDSKIISDEVKPSLLKAVLPILIPIALIVLKTIAVLPSFPFGKSLFYDVATLLGEPFSALLIGLFFALLLPSNFKFDYWSSKGWVGQAIYDAAIVLLITGAGGAFGKVLQSSPISEIITEKFLIEENGIWLPFLIAAALKSAQGSSTVAIITTASLIAPLTPALGLNSEFGLALTVSAIGAGSVVVSHANDSFFWVVVQMSGLNISEGYKYQSTGTGILGASAMLLIFILSLFLI